MIENFEAKVAAFAALVQSETRARLRREDLACESNIENATVVYKLGPKYAKVDFRHPKSQSGAGRYMVVNETGEIFGIKAYGVIHRGHRYGTLDTINEFFWGEYTGIKKPVLSQPLSADEVARLNQAAEDGRKAAIAAGSIKPDLSDFGADVAAGTMSEAEAVAICADKPAPSNIIPLHPSPDAPEPVELELPMIHLNGTSGAQLRQNYLDAYHAVEKAREAISAIEFNSRDYTHPEGRWDKAAREHRARLAKLGQVADELMQIAIHCDKWTK